MEKSMGELAKLALGARDNAYVPYSGYAVGAALLCEDGEVYEGCNVENASYGACNCAERTALFKAVSEGRRRFRAIAVAGGKAGMKPGAYAYPCGICRQVMQELCGPEFQIAVVLSEEVYELYTLKDLLPHGFGGKSLL